MIPVLSAMTGECVVCGEVASERDLLWIETQSEADKHSASRNDLICRECAGCEDDDEDDEPEDDD